MSFKQVTSRDKLLVDADSVRVPFPLRPMSRRHIMSISIKAAEIAGLASNGLFDTASAYTAMQDDYQAILTANDPDYCTTLDPEEAWFDEADRLTADLLYSEAQENRAIPHLRLGDIQPLAAEVAEEGQVGSIIAIPEGVGR